MDIFNKKKIAVKDEEIRELCERLAIYEKEEKRRKRIEGNGAHTTGVWCSDCVHSKIETFIGSFPTRFCMLDNPCSDLEENKNE